MADVGKTLDVDTEFYVRSRVFITTNKKKKCKVHKTNKIWESIERLRQEGFYND
jgi:hypothetical protein